MFPEPHVLFHFKEIFLAVIGRGPLLWSVCAVRHLTMVAIVVQAHARHPLVTLMLPSVR